MTRRTLLKGLSASMIPSFRSYVLKHSYRTIGSGASEHYIVPISLEHVLIHDAFWAPKSSK